MGIVPTTPVSPRIAFQASGFVDEQELPSDESGYEIAAAVVYERRGQWFRIALPQGSGWITRRIEPSSLLVRI
jgi:hypothetical protein